MAGIDCATLRHNALVDRETSLLRVRHRRHLRIQPLRLCCAHARLLLYHTSTTLPRNRVNSCGNREWT
jgi:hypothetical protein